MTKDEVYETLKTKIEADPRFCGCKTRISESGYPFIEDERGNTAFFPLNDFQASFFKEEGSEPLYAIYLDAAHLSLSQERDSNVNGGAA